MSEQVYISSLALLKMLKHAAFEPTFSKSVHPRRKVQQVQDDLSESATFYLSFKSDSAFFYPASTPWRPQKAWTPPPKQDSVSPDCSQDLFWPRLPSDPSWPQGCPRLHPSRPGSGFPRRRPRLFYHQGQPRLVTLPRTFPSQPLSQHRPRLTEGPRHLLSLLQPDRPSSAPSSYGGPRFPSATPELSRRPPVLDGYLRTFPTRTSLSDFAPGHGRLRPWLCSVFSLATDGFILVPTMALSRLPFDLLPNSDNSLIGCLSLRPLLATPGQPTSVLDAGSLVPIMPDLRSSPDSASVSSCSRPPPESLHSSPSPGGVSWLPVRASVPVSSQLPGSELSSPALHSSSRRNTECQTLSQHCLGSDTWLPLVLGLESLLTPYSPPLFVRP